MTTRKPDPAAYIEVHSTGPVRWPPGLSRTPARLLWFGRLSALPPGLDLASLARAFRAAKPTVHKWAHLFDYPLNDSRRRAGPRERWDAVDWTQRDSEIARELGVSRERVRQVRQSRGLPPRRAGKSRTRRREISRL